MYKVSLKFVDSGFTSTKITTRTYIFCIKNNTRYNICLFFFSLTYYLNPSESIGFYIENIFR